MKSLSQMKKLKEVTANDKDGFAGGFVGSSQTGGLADVAVSAVTPPLST